MIVSVVNLICSKTNSGIANRVLIPKIIVDELKLKAKDRFTVELKGKNIIFQKVDDK